MACRFLILVAFCTVGASACAENIDITIHQKGNIELFEKYFQIDKSFIADSYISLSINDNALLEFESMKCDVFARVDYVLNNSTSFSVLFDDLEPSQLARQKINVGMVNEKAVIALQFGNVKQSCAKDAGMVKEYGYYFDVAEILRIEKGAATL